MFRLFTSIFGKTDSPLPEGVTDALVEQAIERALDGTDPRMRILPDYAKALREPVIHAIEHVIALVRQLAAPAFATRAGRDNSPALGVAFTSAARMDEILVQDKALRDYLAASPQKAGNLFGLLVMQHNEKTVFGYALVDDKLMSDVKQTVISFDEHRLLDIADNEQETRRLLMRRAFDYILSMALHRIAEQHDEREKLSQQRALLRVKLDILARGGSGFSADMGPQDRAALQARLDEVESQIVALGPAHEVLQGNLTVVAAVLREAEKHLWLEDAALHLDTHYVLHDANDSSVPATAMQLLHDSQGRKIAALMLAFDPGQIACGDGSTAVPK